MKKLLKIVSISILIISICISILIILSNIIPIVRILFFGITVGGEYPDTIWWEKTTLKGIEGIKTYYSVWGTLVYIYEIPIIIICIIYQIVYFKIIKKK